MKNKLFTFPLIENACARKVTLYLILNLSNAWHFGMLSDVVKPLRLIDRVIVFNANALSTLNAMLMGIGHA